MVPDQDLLPVESCEIRDTMMFVILTRSSFARAKIVKYRLRSICFNYRCCLAVQVVWHGLEHTASGPITTIESQLHPHSDVRPPYIHESNHTSAMRSLEHARESWQRIAQFKSLEEFKAGIVSTAPGAVLTSRSIYWKASNSARAT